MTDNDKHDRGEKSAGDSDPERDQHRTDGGATVTSAAQDHRETDYLEREVNLLKPSTPFMRDHLKVVWGTFVAWLLIVWGPVTLTWLAPDLMTTTLPVIQFPAHYFLVAFGAPTGALILAAVYARQRDKLDNKYGIDPATTGPVDDSDAGADTDAAATDGGVER